MYAILQCDITTVHGWIPTWRAPNVGPLLSHSTGYPLLGDFKESAQEPPVHFNMQPAT